MAISTDLLRKKVWKGEKGRQAYSSLMQKARPLFQPPSGESGRASPPTAVLHGPIALGLGLGLGLVRGRVRAGAYASLKTCEPLTRAPLTLTRCTRPASTCSNSRGAPRTRWRQRTRQQRHSSLPAL